MKIRLIQSLLRARAGDEAKAGRRPMKASQIGRNTHTHTQGLCGVHPANFHIIAKHYCMRRFTGELTRGMNWDWREWTADLCRADSF